MDLLFRHALEALQRVVETAAERQVAARVLVEEGIVVEDALVVDGRIVSDERAFAELRGALVHCDHLFEEVLVLLRLDFDGPAALKAHGEVFDELALIGERLGRIDDALRFPRLGRDEDLLRRDVGVEIAASRGLLAAAHEDGIGDEPHLEVGAVGGTVFERHEPEAVEIVATGGERVVVARPFAHGVCPVRTGSF